MSSEGNGPGSEFGADAAAQSDPWFEPVRRADSPPASNGHAGNLGDVDGEWAGNDARHADEWFLRTGRAGLQPESMTVSWDDGETGEATAQRRYEAAGAPPWAADVVQTDGEPPPWESGPWPEPGEKRAGGAASGASRPVTAGGRTAAPARQPQSGLAGNWQARAALLTGILPLLVPGIVFGVLGLRRSRAVGAGQAASWGGIALSVAWAAVIGFLVFGTGGSTPGGCSVPRGVNAAYSRVMNDLNGGAAKSAQTLDLSTAARQANSAAAYADQLPLRNALFAMARDLEQAQSDVAGRTHRVPAALRQKLGADGAALTSACKS